MLFECVSVVVTECNLGLVLGARLLMVRLVDIVVFSAEWLADAWFDPIKSLSLPHGLSRLRQRKIALAARIMMQLY